MLSSTAYNSRGIGSVDGSSSGGGNGGRDDGGPPKKLTRSSRACDGCHREHQPCKRSDPSNPRSSCLRCDRRRLPCTYNRTPLQRGPSPGNKVKLDVLQQQMNNVMTALALAPTLASAPAPAALPSIAPASSSSQGAGTLQLPQTHSPVDSRLVSDSASPPPRFLSMSLSSAAAPNPEVVHHPQYVDHSLVTGSPSVARILPQSWAAVPFMTPTATPLPAAAPSPSMAPDTTPLTTAAPTPSMPPSAMLATTLSAISQPPPSPQFPPLNTFRDMYYYARQPQLRQYYEQQAQNMSPQELAAILQMLATLVRTVENVQNTGSGNAGSDGGAGDAGQ